MRLLLWFYLILICLPGTIWAKAQLDPSSRDIDNSYLLQEASRMERKVSDFSVQVRKAKTSQVIFCQEQSRNLGFKMVWNDDPMVKHVPIFLVGYGIYTPGEPVDAYLVRIGFTEKTVQLKNPVTAFFDDNANYMYDPGERVEVYKHFWTQFASLGLKKYFASPSQGLITPFVGLNIGFIMFHNEDFNNTGIDFGAECGFALNLSHNFFVENELEFTYSHLFKENDFRGRQAVWSGDEHEGNDLFYSWKIVYYY